MTCKQLSIWLLVSLVVLVMHVVGFIELHVGAFLLQNLISIYVFVRDIRFEYKDPQLTE